jgi:hypothetical protein
MSETTKQPETPRLIGSVASSDFPSYGPNRKQPLCTYIIKHYPVGYYFNDVRLAYNNVSYYCNHYYFHSVSYCGVCSSPFFEQLTVIKLFEKST